MPDQAGIYKRLQRWVARAAAGATNNAVEWDADGDDVAAALNNRLTRDGLSSMGADLPMANHSMTGIRQAVTTGEPVEFGQWKASSGAVLNILDNASFNVNQRGVSGTVTLAAGAYGHDRWKAGTGGCTYSYAQNGPDTQITIQSGSLLQIVHLDDVPGGVLTLGAANGSTAQGRVYQGTTTAFAALPLQSGSLVGGSAATVEFGSGVVFQPQLEAGSAQHAYSRRTLVSDALICASYYEVQALDLAFYSGSTAFRFALPFAAPKIAVPAVTVTSTNNPLGLSAAAQGITRFNTNINFGNINNQGTAPWAGTVAASCEP